MWPAEGSVCQAMIPLLVAEPASSGSPPTRRSSACSTDGWVGRDGQGCVRNPEMLYRPWRRRREGARAADRLPRSRAERPDRLPLPAQRRPSRPPTTSSASSKRSAAPPRASGEQPALVSVILDGENCWEYYPDGGVEFLRALYRRAGPASADQAGAGRRLPATSIRPTRQLRQLFAGSWISHNFAHLDRPPGGQPGLGPARPRRASRAGRAAERQRTDAGRTGAGLGGDVHRRGERLVLVVRRSPFQQPGRAVRPPVPQAPAERLHAAGREPPAELSRPIGAEQPHRPPLHAADRSA